MKAETTAETIHFERSDAIAGHGPVTFLTVLLHAATGNMLRCESHVFIEADETHLHEISFNYTESPDEPHVLRDAICHTHQLFANQHLRQTLANTATLTYRNTRSAELPFATWIANARFSRVLASLPDLTASRQLREAAINATTTRGATSGSSLGRFEY